MRSVRNEIGNIMSEVAAYETAASVEPAIARRPGWTRAAAEMLPGVAARRPDRGAPGAGAVATYRVGGLLWLIAAAVLLVLLVAGCLFASRAAGVIVCVVLGRAAEVEAWHRDMARDALTAAGPHRPAAEEEPNTRDVRSTLSATTERTHPPRSYNAARNIIAGRPFGFGMPDA
jgi:hypothetical protein